MGVPGGASRCCFTQMRAWVGGAVSRGVTELMLLETD